MKHLKKFLAVLLVFTLFIPVPQVRAQDSYEIHGAVTVTIPIPGYEDGTPHPEKDYWYFSQFVYEQIWQQQFSTYRGTDDDMLRDVPLTDQARTINAENAKKYISCAIPGATIRVMDRMDGPDSIRYNFMHSQIVVYVDDDGVMIYEGNMIGARVQLKYYTWEDYEAAWAKNKYFKYIKYPGAPSFIDIHTCDSGTFVSRDESHPHLNLYTCSVCGKLHGDPASAEYVKTCSYCNAVVDTGYYYLKNKESGMYLTSLSTADILVLSDLPERGTARQVSIRVTDSGYRLCPAGDSSRAVNAAAALSDDWNVTSQRWRFESVSEGYIIHNLQNPSAVLGADGTEVVVKADGREKGQIWELEKVPVSDKIRIVQTVFLRRLAYAALRSVLHRYGN